MWPVQLVFPFLLYVEYSFPPGLCNTSLNFHLPLVFGWRLSRKCNNVVVFWNFWTIFPTDKLVPPTNQTPLQPQNAALLLCVAVRTSILHVNFCLRLILILEACVLCVSHLTMGWISKTAACQHSVFRILIRKHWACIYIPKFRFFLILSYCQFFVLCAMKLKFCPTDIN